MTTPQPSDTPRADQWADLRALEAAATPGPWRHTQRGIEAGEYDEVFMPGRVECMAYCYGGSSTIDGDRIDLDGAFIAAARNAVPDLLAEVDRLRAALVEAERLRDYWKASYWEQAARAEQAERQVRELPEQIAQAIEALGVPDDVAADGPSTSEAYVFHHTKARAAQIARALSGVSGPTTPDALHDACDHENHYCAVQFSRPTTEGASDE